MSPDFYKKCKFGDCAVELGIMSRNDVERIFSRQNISNQKMGHICVQEGLITPDEAARIMARQYGYEYAAPDDIELDDPDLMRRIPLDLMTRHRFVPLRRDGDRLFIGMSSPGNRLRIEDDLALSLDMELAVVVVSEARILKLLKKIEESRSFLDEASDDMRLPVVRDTDTGRTVFSLDHAGEEESKTVRLVNSTLLDAITKKASDIHIETSDQGVIIRYRIDGMLYQATEPLDVQHQSAIISRIKVMSELDISEKRIPQDGRFKIRFRDRFIDFRVSILPTIFGEDSVLRILDRESLKAGDESFRLDGINLPDTELARIRRMIRAPYGMFLMTGPTGSGKTTTLYRALSEVRSKDTKIITIEDPVEYQLKGIVQIQVNEKKGLTFAKGLRSILRHDPDKILVGEIRDAETAQIAIQSALTGHLVFTTVHANRSFEVINRFTHMGIQSYDLMAALNCIVAQRLVRTLCSCKETARLPDSLLVESGLDPEQLRQQVFYQPKGCEQCKGTGFRGRKAIIELVELDDDMREMFIRRAPAAELRQKALDMGTVFLRGAALREVFSGETTLDEANRMTFVEI